jgi:hypothetical protein
MIGSLVGPLQARAQLLLRRCLAICSTLVGLPVDHAIHHVNKCYKRILGVYEAANRRDEDRDQAEAEIVSKDQFGMTCVLTIRTPAQKPWTRITPVSSA